MIQEIRKIFEGYNFKVDEERTAGDTLVFDGKSQVSSFWVDVVDNHVEICRHQGGVGGGVVKKVVIWSGELKRPEDIKLIVTSKFL